jgi:hypothetical protein
VTDDEITALVIRTVTEKFRYGPEEFDYVAVGVITDALGIDDDFVRSELVDEWIRQFLLAIGNTIGYARALAQVNHAAGLGGTIE